MKSYSLSEIARFAGVSRTTLYRWIRRWDREALCAMGCPPGTKRYSPKAVQYLADRYAITIPE